MKTAKQIIETLKNASGRVTTVKFKGTVGTAAAFKGLSITKITSAVVRSGVDFANLATVKEGIANGERDEVKPLSWGKWMDFPYIINHTNKMGEYKEYVRLYPSINSKQIPTVSYFVDGVETPKAEILQYLTNSAVDKMTNGEKPECFTLTTSNILDM